MLRIIYEDASKDLTQTLFGEIAESLEKLRSGASAAKRVLLIVPAQFTLRAEELAFESLREPGFFDFHVMSGNRLAQRIMRETGGMGRTPVDALGRSMLLKKIAREQGKGLSVFSAVADDPGFLDMAGDFIVQMKQNNLSPESLSEAASLFEDGSLLSGKLADMRKIYSAYEAAMEGSFNDSEDLRAFVSSRVKDCSFVREAEIFYYDFYSFTKRDTDFLEQLIIHSCGLNLLLLKEGGGRRTELFSATEHTEKGLIRRAKSLSSEYELRKALLPERERPEELKHLEREFLQVPPSEYGGKPDRNVLRLVRCASPLTQAEAIAAEILRLVREEDWTCPEIAVLTEDLAEQGFAIKRMLEVYGIPVFMDEKRSVEHDPAVQVLSSLLDITADGISRDAVLRFLKSGLSGLAAESDIEEFENYISSYHINSEKFLNPFKYGIKAVGEECFMRCEQLRRRLAALLEPLIHSLGGTEPISVRKRSELIYNFLTDTLELPDRLDKVAAALAEAGLADASEQSAQIWNLLIGLMDQVCELLGDEEFSAAEYRDVLESSFADIRVGLLPQAEGRVLIGSVNRSRVSGIKALFIAGLNDGILPSDADAEGILSEQELALLEERGFVPAKNSERMAEEEMLTIYRAFAEPSEYLWLGYPAAGADGKERKPSVLVEWLKSAFPLLEEESDPKNSGDFSALLNSPSSAALHLTSAFRQYISGEEHKLEEIWKGAWNVLLESGDEKTAVIKEGLFYRNDSGKLRPEKAAELYGIRGDAASLSPSRIETFAACPFKHFISYGLRPEEERSFEAGRIEQGEIYHEYFRRLGEELGRSARARSLPLNDPSSTWMTITPEELEELTDAILKKIGDSYSEGLMKSSAPERYRSRRLKEVCLANARRLIDQFRRGRIEEIFFEMPFGTGKTFPPFEFDTPLGRVQIYGKIDRVDIIRSEGGEYVKIIDYKSGSARFDAKSAERGLAVQLSVYLESALAAAGGSEPAGMFYCHISEPAAEASVSDIGASEIADDLLEKLFGAYRMSGMLVDEPSVIAGIDSEILPKKKSFVVDITREAGDIYRGSAAANLVSREDFDKFRISVIEKIKELCTDLISGRISIEPERIPGSRDNTACGRCDYRSICIFERGQSIRWTRES